MNTRALSCLLTLVACTGGENPNNPDGGGGSGGDETPITQRASSGTYQCTQQRGRTDHSPRSWQVVPPALTTTSKGAFLARLESTGDSPFMQSLPQLLVSSFDAAGTIGAPPITLGLASPQEAGALASAPRGDGFALCWVDGTRLRFTAFDAVGQVIVPAGDVVDGVDRLAGPMLAAGPDGGFGLVYAPDTGGGAREVRLVVLDPLGGVRTPPRVLAKPGPGFTHPAPAITAAPGGYAMAWRDASSMAGGIDFATADTAGSQQVAPHRVSPAAAPGAITGGLTGFEPPTTALLSVPGGYLVAWTEVRPGQGDAGASSIVRLARLDAAGVRQGGAPPLRAPARDIDEVEPTLLPFHDTVAVLWGRGSHIYICGGCIPDHSIELLLLDPATLTPTSNQLSLGNGGDPRGGGLLRRRVAALGDTLLTTYLLNFHVHATPGSAAFRCAKP